VELRRVAGEEPQMSGVVFDAARHDGPIVANCLGLPTAMSYQR
jgi:hypothetical protein